jgi:hypothetical protein
MEILTDFLCFEQTTFDVAYVTELDPLWQDSALTSILNPEVALFSPIRLQRRPAPRIAWLRPRNCRSTRCSGARVATVRCIP